MALHKKHRDNPRSEPLRTWAEQYRPALHRYLMRLLRDPQDAQDFAQEVYVRFFQLPEGHAIRNPAAYLLRIATNLVYEYRIRPDRQVVTYDSEIADERAQVLPSALGSDPSHQLTSAEHLDRVLAQIPPAYRQALLLHKRDGLSYAEISARLGISLEAVKKRIVRALAYGRRARWD